MKKKMEEVKKGKNFYFEINSDLNGNNMVLSIGPCERKCITCNVSSKECRHS